MDITLKTSEDIRKYNDSSKPAREYLRPGNLAHALTQWQPLSVADEYALTSSASVNTLRVKLENRNE